MTRIVADAQIDTTVMVTGLHLDVVGPYGSICRKVDEAFVKASRRPN